MAVRILKRKYKVTNGAPITDLHEAIKITFALKVSRGEFALYRGQARNFILRPAVFRLARWHRHERDMVRDLISTHPQEFSEDALMLDRLVRMQHYGLPTRLLDVTQNFLAALYFACARDIEKPKIDGVIFIIRGNNILKKYYDSDSVSLVSNLCNLSEEEKFDLFASAPDNEVEPENDNFNKFPATDRLLQFVRNEKPHFRSKALKVDLHRTFFVIPKKNNRRIIAQSGAFLIFGLVGNDRNPDLSMFNVTRHPVPEGSKDSIKASLETLGITQSSLFPEIDRAAAYISVGYKAS
jgi:hypothetical protein